LGLTGFQRLLYWQLAIQEVAVIVVAKRKNIDLSQKGVEEILREKLQHTSFYQQYEAFCKKVKETQGIDMPTLTTDFRRMRAAVIHDGYNPQPEEIEAIVPFTLGLLNKLKNID